MSFELRIDVNEPAPIWRQIEQGIRRGIASGGLQPGDATPSVREAAVRLRVNPATVARAYRSLVDAGLLLVKRGEGTFVTGQAGDAAGTLRREELERAARRYAETARGLGVGLGDALRAVEDAWPAQGAAQSQRTGGDHE